jgi:hypothetical protein
MPVPGHEQPDVPVDLRERIPRERCEMCDADWSDHLVDIALRFSALWRIPHPPVLRLVQLWWTEVCKWVQDRPDTHSGVTGRDVSLADAVLHHLATTGPSDSASSPHLGSADMVSLATAHKGIGPAGSVHVPPDLWRDWADPNFAIAGATTPSQGSSNCPKAAAMLRALFQEGLLAPTSDPANAQVFVKYKSQEKAALILNMVQFNHQCAYKSRPFRLPTLEGLAAALRGFYGQAWACKLDIKNCYWSVHLPPPLLNSLRIAAGPDKYAIVRVPFGWHQAPGLVQHLISRILDVVDTDSILLIQYLDDILVVGKHSARVRDVTRQAADALEKAGFLISQKSLFEPTRRLGWMGKVLDLLGPRIEPTAPFIADVVTRWLKLALRPYHNKDLRRLLGKLVWLGRLRRCPGHFWQALVCGSTMGRVGRPGLRLRWCEQCWSALLTPFGVGPPPPPRRLCPQPVFLLMRPPTPGSQGVS